MAWDVDDIGLSAKGSTRCKQFQVTPLANDSNGFPMFELVKL